MQKEVKRPLWGRGKKEKEKRNTRLKAKEFLMRRGKLMEVLARLLRKLNINLL